MSSDSFNSLVHITWVHCMHVDDHFLTGVEI
uniref:Uncharacterized protein n=1 Tax=Arundo donax TaxID=35708 RepID=A0A0A9GUG9_ARUDO